MARARNSIVITLIETGATAWSEGQRILGAADLPLTDAGRTWADHCVTCFGSGDRLLDGSTKARLNGLRKSLHTEIAASA